MEFYRRVVWAVPEYPKITQFIWVHLILIKELFNKRQAGNCGNKSGSGYRLFIWIFSCNVFEAQHR